MARNRIRRNHNPVLRGRVTEYIGGPTGNHSLVYRHDENKLMQKDGKVLSSNPIDLHSQGIAVPTPLRTRLLRDVHERTIQDEMSKKRAEMEEYLLQEQAALEEKLAEMDARIRRGEMEPTMVEQVTLPEPPPPLFPEEIEAFSQEQPVAEEETEEEPTTRRRRRS